MRFHPALLPLGLSAMLAVPLAAPLAAQEGMQAMASGRATTEVTLVLVDSAARAAAQPSKIRIDYGQPHLRGRTLHAGGLVPYDSLWRTGANAATTLTTDVDLVVGGANVPKGTYVLQTLPSRTGWKLLIQRQVAPPAEAGAAAPAERPTDVARIDLRQAALSAPLESLTFWLIPRPEPGSPRGELRLAWGTVLLSTDWSVR